MTKSSAADLAVVRHRNELLIVGRVTTEPQDRVLPSGDEITTWRLTVDRPGEGTGFDVIDCTAWTARLRRSASAWNLGDVVEVSGAVRRRFWRTGAGPASRYDVEVVRAKRVATEEVSRPRKRG